MKTTWKRIGSLAIGLILLLCLAAGCAPQGEDTPSADDPSPDTNPSSAGSASISSENTGDAASPAEPENEDTPEQTISPAEAEALQTAEQYRTLYENVFSAEGTEVALYGNKMGEILSCLGDLGYAAIDFDGEFSMKNPALITQFTKDVAAGSTAELSIYQINRDAGFLCHTLHFENGTCTVTRTRLAWLSGGPFLLPGTVPTITYSDTYTVTDIGLSGGRFYYEYDMPDNPEGGNHDGHIDTEVIIPVSA